MLQIPLPDQQRTSKPVVCTPSGQKIRISPGSVNAKMERPRPPNGQRTVPLAVAYGEATRGESTLTTRDTTAAPPHALALVAGALRPLAEDPKPKGTTNYVGLTKVVDLV